MSEEGEERRGGFWAAFPLLALPVLLYNVAALLLVEGGLNSAGAGAALSRIATEVGMASGGTWVISFGDVVLITALIVLFVELLRAASSKDGSNATMRSSASGCSRLSARNRDPASALTRTPPRPR